MKTKKFKGFIITDAKPKAGDTLVCINSKSVNHGTLAIVGHLQVKHDTIDCKNWKVVVNFEERREAIIDDVIESLKKDIAQGDVTVLDEFLKMIPDEKLIQALNESEWKQYSKIKRK